MDKFQRTLMYDTHNPVAHKIAELEAEHGMAFEQYFSWSTSTPSQPLDRGHVLAAVISGSSVQAAYDYLPTGYAQVSFDSGRINVWAHSHSLADGLGLRDILQKLYPILVVEDDETAMNFWMLGARGPEQIVRRIAIPSWKDIQDNYPAAVRASLDKTLSYDNGDWSTDGQLILWQGDPGMGKTYAIRALTDSWRKWSEFHYIIDPEKFLSDGNYMMRVLMSDNIEAYNFDSDEEPNRSKYKVIILEDAGELVKADAKEAVGQALSRLLNILDGLIGQGLRVIILITTNEDIKKIHPAMQRFGRCAQNLQFAKFDRQEIIEWCEAKDLEISDKHNATLSELYAHANGVESIESVIGFG